MLAFAEFQVGEVTGGIAPDSPLGLLILAIGTVFTVGLPIIMILKGRK